MGSFGAFCKIFEVFTNPIPPVAIQFQPNFIESMVIKGGYRLLRFDYLLILEENMALRIFLKTGPYWAYVKHG